ncbi:hypothetical protein GW17_00052002 [Ensete ventricosum]|nr:hypothetical protein GW17_00052002 [Ensete ventricosum]
MREWFACWERAMTIGRRAVHRPPPPTPHRPPLGYLAAKRNPYHCWWGGRVPQRMSTARCLSKKGSYSRRQRRRGCRQGGDGHCQSVSDEHDDGEVKEEGELSTEEVAIVARRVQQWHGGWQGDNDIDAELGQQARQQGLVVCHNQSPRFVPFPMRYA